MKLEEELQNYALKRGLEINNIKEDILAAFIAKYGCEPDELNLVQADVGMQFFVTKGEKPSVLKKCPTCGLFKHET